MNRQPYWQYEQISAELMREIDAGDLEIGTKLPSEKQLGDLFDVSRITVRKALAELEEKGYIEKRQGQGSFVKDRFKANEEISFVDVPSTQLRGRGYSVYIELREFQILADGQEPSIRQMMKLSDSDYLYRVSQLYLSDRQPLIERTTYMAFESFPMLTAKELQDSELIPLLAHRYGLSPALLTHTISSGVDNVPTRLRGFLTATPRNLYVKATTTYTNQLNHIVYYSTAIAPAKSKVFFVKDKGEDNMAEPHILLTRIDNRLVHGQVGVTWTKTLGANLILVANDDASQDELQQKLMKSTADSSGAQIRFFTLQKTIDIIGKAADRQKIFIVVKTPADAAALVKGGVPIKEVNVGNMHFSAGKEEVTKKVYVDQKDKDDLMELVHAGVNVYIEDVPGDPKTPVNFD